MSHWGEFESIKKQPEDLVPAEFVKILIMKAMQQDNLKQVLPHPPADKLLELKSVALAIDDRVIHTIKLLQHAREMDQLIEAAKEQTELMADSHIHTFPPALDIPVHFIPPNHHTTNSLQYTDKVFNEFTEGVGESLPELSTYTTNLLLKKSVAALVAHAGYETALDSTLNVVTAIVSEYIKKFLQILRMQIDQGANFKNHGFPDVMERVFYEMNIGSMRTLHDYYQNNVVKYRERMLEECLELNREYNNISIPSKNDAITMDSLTKLEEADDVPEIHFPALGDGDGVDELQPSLESGFQMLHNLEQQVHLQSLESQDEEMVNSISPGSQDQLTMCSSSSDSLQSHISKKRKRV